MILAGSGEVVFLSGWGFGGRGLKLELMWYDRAEYTVEYLVG
jgi:hypothetical protein